MRKRKTVTLFFLYSSAILLSLGLVAVMSLIAEGLKHFKIVGPTVPFAYPWRLDDPTFWSQLTARVGQGLHNVSAWCIIAMARHKKPSIQGRMRWFNWSMFSVHILFFILHLFQTRFWYDGLAQNVPEITSLGSVAFMLMVVLIIEAPRRGIILGKGLEFHKQFIKIARTYHSYFFTWTLIYTFWYHPMEDTPGHLLGFFYMFVLLSQSVFMFHRGHYNRWWKIFLELLVIPHGVIVAIYQGKQLWPMFGFGFGAMFVLTQMYGLGLS